MSNKKKKNIAFFILLLIIGVVLALIKFCNKMGEMETVIIKVDGWNVEYINTNKNLVVEDFKNLELGSSILEVIDKIGTEDAWIGSGIIQPVYFLGDERAVLLKFGEEGLVQITIYEKSGESQILKEK